MTSKFGLTQNIDGTNVVSGIHLIEEIAFNKKHQKNCCWNATGNIVLFLLGYLTRNQFIRRIFFAESDLIKLAGLVSGCLSFNEFVSSLNNTSQHKGHMGSDAKPTSPNKKIYPTIGFFQPFHTSSLVLAEASSIVFSPIGTYWNHTLRHYIYVYISRGPEPLKKDMVVEGKFTMKSPAKTKLDLLWACSHHSGSRS